MLTKYWITCFEAFWNKVFNLEIFQFNKARNAFKFTVYRLTMQFNFNKENLIKN